MYAALFTSVLLAASSASAGQWKTSWVGTGTATLDYPLIGFPIQVEYVMEVTEIITWDNSGNVVRDFWHVVEQDTFSANGKTLVGKPYTANLEYVYRDGQQIAMNASGVVTQVPLPGGGMFTSAGRTDWFNHPGEPYILFVDWGGCSNLERFIAALSP